MKVHQKSAAEIARDAKATKSYMKKISTVKMPSIGGSKP